MLEKEKREWERQLLCCIEHFGQGQKGLSRKLLSLLKEANYYENLRVLLAIGRLQDKYAAPLLCRYILQKKEAVCQIFALDQINQLPLTVNEKKETAILLLTSLPQPKHLSPLTLRAFLWFLATECGDDCLPDLLRVFHERRASWVRDDFWYETLLLAAGKMEELQKIATQDKKLRLFLANNTPPDISKGPHFSIYPSGDYLWHCCQQHGMIKEEFQRFFWFYRK